MASEAFQSDYSKRAKSIEWKIVKEIILALQLLAIQEHRRRMNDSSCFCPPLFILSHNVIASSSYILQLHHLDASSSYRYREASLSIAHQIFSSVFRPQLTIEIRDHVFRESVAKTFRDAIEISSSSYSISHQDLLELQRDMLSRSVRDLLELQLDILSRSIRVRN